MFEEIDPRSPVPLYEQIAQRIRVAVAADEFKAGELLPSVRQLAGALRVNPATVVRAYRDLEHDGFVEMKHGAGTFVLQLPARKRTEERARQARDLVQTMLAEAARIGLGVNEIAQAFHDQTGGDHNG